MNFDWPYSSEVEELLIASNLKGICLYTSLCNKFFFIDPYFQKNQKYIQKENMNNLIR